MRYKAFVASLLLVLMLLAPLADGFAQGDAKISDNKIVVNYDHHGPMQGMRKLAKVDPRLVYALQDEHGNRLDPKKVRKLDGRPLYLPKDAQLDLAQYEKFLQEELRTYGQRARRQTSRTRNRNRRPQVVVKTRIPVITLAGYNDPVVLKPGQSHTVSFTVLADGVPTSVTRSVVIKAQEPPTAKLTTDAAAATSWRERLANRWVYGILVVVLLGCALNLLRLARKRRPQQVKEHQSTYTARNRRNFSDDGSETVQETVVERSETVTGPSSPPVTA